MPEMLTTQFDRPEVGQAADRLLAAPRLVICLCAAWCVACREFLPLFEELARADARATYLWVDIEDDSDLVGEIDIENFPTIAVLREDQPLFIGTLTPQPGVVSRTIDSLFLSDGAGSISAENAALVRLFLERLQARATQFRSASTNSRAENGLKSSIDSPTPMK